MSLSDTVTVQESSSLEQLRQQVEAIERWLGSDHGDVPSAALGGEMDELSDDDREDAQALQELRERIDKCVIQLAQRRDDVAQELDSFGQRKTVARRYLNQEPRR